LTYIYESQLKSSVIDQNLGTELGFGIQIYIYIYCRGDRTCFPAKTKTGIRMWSA